MDPIENIRAILPSDAKALIVEDSAATRRIFKSLLTGLGIEVVEKENGKLAFDYLKQNIHELAVIFSDISMPEMDGFELCYRLQNADWFDGTPFVLVSTQSDAENVIRALKLGADDYLPKPFETGTLAQVLGRVLQHA